LKIKVIPPSTKLKYRIGDDAQRDSHVWLSIDNNLAMLEQFYTELLKWEDSEDLTINYNKIVAELLDLKKDLAIRLKDSGGKILVYHPAYGYFFDQFDIDQIAIEDHGRPPSLKNLMKIKELSEKNDLRSILIRNQMDAKLAAKIAGKLGAELRTINPLAYDLKKTYQELGELVETIGKNK
jgi:zinc transport system substrate-binding protein